MKLKLFLFLLISFFAFGFYFKPSSKIYAIKNVTIIPMNKEGVLKDQTIIIENGKIIRIGHSSKVALKEGMEVIEGKGKYVLPGFLTCMRISFTSRVIM